MTKIEKIIIGRNESVDIGKLVHDIPAKIDTGADTSSIWVSNVHVDKNGTLEFSLFGPGSPYYTGKVLKRDSYSVAVVRSASGHEQLRYRTQMSLKIAGKRIRATFNLSDRSKNKFPILIGRKTLNNRFIVDVSKARYSEDEKVFQNDNRVMNRLLTEDPYKFYKKHYRKTGLSIRSSK